MVGPSCVSDCRATGTRLAVSSPSKPMAVWVPSQNGLVFDRPHRQSLYVAADGNDLPSTQSQETPSSLGVMTWTARGTDPQAMSAPAPAITSFSPREIVASFVGIP